MTHKLAAVVRRLIAEALAPTLYHPPTRYRVVSMNAARVNLQIVRKSRGLPDLVSVSQVGMAGSWSKLVAGSVVLVAFVEGDPSLPVVIGAYSTPEETTIDASQKLLIGASADTIELASGSAVGVVNKTGRVLRYGDLVNVPGVGDVVLGSPAVPTTCSKVRA